MNGKRRIVRNIFPPDFRLVKLIKIISKLLMNYLRMRKMIFVFVFKNQEEELITSMEFRHQK